MHKTTSIQRNPSYPARTHAYEGPHWRSILAEAERRLAAATARLAAAPDGPNKAAAVKLIHQLGGARDQVAESAARLPQEVGELYEEDHHRLDQALAAFDRIEARLVEVLA